MLIPLKRGAVAIRKAIKIAASISRLVRARM
jgi:hypothetical protein